MKVSELIEQLQEYPPTTEVLIQPDIHDSGLYPADIITPLPDWQWGYSICKGNGNIEVNLPKSHFIIIS